MAEVVESLETPLLLVAMPQVLDPFFNRSVVLLLEHKEEGSFGFILNHATEFTLREVLEGLEVPWGGPEDTPAWLGGPVQPNLGTALFGDGYTTPREQAEAVIPLTDGLYLSQDVRVLGTLAETPPERFKLMIGYAGWGPGQLEQELERNDWLIAPLDLPSMFDRDAGGMWARALRSIGVRPESLPSWTMPEEGGSN